MASSFLTGLGEGTVRDLVGREDWLPRGDYPSLSRLLMGLANHTGPGEDLKRWRLSSNGVFSVKSFYSFLVDGGIRCPWTPVILKGSCPRKVNLINWLAWEDKILSLENLALRRCNLLPSTTCVMCHSNVESTNHLFLQCPVALHVWGFFGHLFDVRSNPSSMRDLWGNWRKNIKRPLSTFWDLLIRAITWNIWIERNARIFSSSCASNATIIVKIVHMLLMWLNAVPEAKRAKLEEPIKKIKKSLEFVATREVELNAPPEHISSTGEV
ncbi:uncharacterized protein LOC120254543 [Dioscorea cayenensis subsp. rotundata]|uniref:Uncharacterized protein LOC120254543 n=1 Tax=Dioscorea cayennensis subsp. rotundata TaxID=55577 RepID=A0AB40AU60_DIOCR|nr:uncharacterized protein LOC120254543 [Dioscorea cayenensis subsp. rotundata]